jgi:glycosyltransferase involved in cell wall biosynthesis
MRPMRVLHLGKYYAPEPGGIETVLEMLCRGERATVDSRALVVNTTRATIQETVAGVPVTRVGRYVSAGAVSIAPTLPWWLAHATADVLVLHEPNPMALLAYAVARPRAPLIVWYHSEVVRPRWQYDWGYRPLLEFALRRAARIVVASPPMMDVPALSEWRDKCSVIPFGLDAARYDATPAVSEAAAALRGDTDRPVLLFVGRLVGYKGLDVLLRALPGLRARMVIVGDGPRRAELEGLATGLGIGESVQFVGRASDADVLAWYHACDAFVLPSTSRQEAFGMVQLEAMLCGKPVVSTDVGTGVSWVNQHDETGLVVAPGDVEALRAALGRLLHEPATRARLGAQARARALAHFTAERMCASTVALYHETARPAVAAPSAQPARVS